MNKSYDVNVAKLAGIPLDIIERSNELLSSLESKQNIQSNQIKEIIKERKDDIIAEEIKELDPYNMSPFESLNYLIDLKKRIKYGKNIINVTRTCKPNCSW